MAVRAAVKVTREISRGSLKWIGIVALNRDLNEADLAQNCKYFLQILAIESKNAP